VHGLVLDSLSVSAEGPQLSVREAKGRTSLVEAAPVVQRAFGYYVKVKEHAFSRLVVVGAVRKEWVVLTTDPCNTQTHKDGQTAAVLVVHRDLLYTQLLKVGDADKCPSTYLVYVCRMLRDSCIHGNFEAALAFAEKREGCNRVADVARSAEEAEAFVQHEKVEDARKAREEAEEEARKAKDLKEEEARLARQEAEEEARKAKEESESTARAVITERWPQLKADLIKEVDDRAKAKTAAVKKALETKITNLSKKVR